MVQRYEHSHVVSNAKTGSGRRAVGERMPKVVESSKRLLLLKGHATSGVGTEVLQELDRLKKPLTKKLSRKNEVLPFEAGGETHLENLCRLNDCSLFGLVNHSKKRPHNLVMGRMFGQRVLDMVEFGVTELKGLGEFGGTGLKKTDANCGCVVVMNGGDFERSAETRTIRSVLTDVLRPAAETERVDPGEIGRAVVVTLRDEKRVSLRQYSVGLGKNKKECGLQETGPRMELVVRRVQCATEEAMKVAMRKPRDPGWVKKVKNVSRDEMGDKVGRVHVGRQDVSELALARMKGLGKKRKGGAGGAGGAGGEVEGEGEGESEEVGGAKKRGKTEST